MVAGISGAPIAASLPYAAIINNACISNNVPPLLAYAIACNETIVGEMCGKWNACTIVSADNGHGIFQLTSSWPDDWSDPEVNSAYACHHFIRPALDYWIGRGLSGGDLVRCVAATFNAGLGNAIAGHDRGDVDAFTTDRYGARAYAFYSNLLATGRP